MNDDLNKLVYELYVKTALDYGWPVLTYTEWLKIKLESEIKE